MNFQVFSPFWCVQSIYHPIILEVRWGKHHFWRIFYLLFIRGRVWNQSIDVRVNKRFLRDEVILSHFPLMKSRSFTSIIPIKAVNLLKLVSLTVFILYFSLFNWAAAPLPYFVIAYQSFLLNQQLRFQLDANIIKFIQNETSWWRFADQLSVVGLLELVYGWWLIVVIVEIGVWCGVDVSVYWL